MINWWNVLVSALLSLIPAVAVAILTVRLSIKQFHSQRWWEKKSEVYSDISKDLSRLFFCMKEFYREAIREKKLTDKRMRELNNEYIARIESFEMIAAGGAFIVSEEVHKEIEILIDNLGSNSYKQDKESFEDYLGRDYDTINKFKSSYNKLAKEDLKIK